MIKVDAVIFDLDGTLADITHRLHHIDKDHADENGHYSDEVDWDAFNDACHRDKPHKDIIELLRMYKSRHYVVWILSGRGDSAREKTIAWLKEHDVPYDFLMMRPEKDFRPDEVLKAQMLEEVQTHYVVHLCVDDRSKVVRMWREKGLRCLQVAQGDF